MKVIYSLVTIIITSVIIEILAMAGHYIKFREIKTPSETKVKIEENINIEEISTTLQANTDLQGKHGKVQVIHPFVGYVFDPNRDGSGIVSDFGFPTGKLTNPIQKKSPNKIIIGIFGGSFAQGIYSYSASLIREKLKSNEKEIILLNFARGGGKQPEQLAILAYMLSLGAQFDMVLNIDGFNEVALPPADNIPKGVYPFYPRQWFNRARTLFDPLELKQLGYLEFLKSSKENWAIFFNDRKLYRSAALSLIWELGDHWLGKKIFGVRQKIDSQKKGPDQYVFSQQSLSCLKQKEIPKDVLNSLQHLPKGTPLRKEAFLGTIRQSIEEEQYAKYHQAILKCTTIKPVSYVMTGPQYRFDTEEQLYHDLASVWKKSSQQMSALCKANQIEYYHFLQPNQYIDGSKIMSSKEKQIALNENQPYRAGAIQGYPLLRQYGDELIGLGVNFDDLTMVFQNNNEILYNDDCCHLNKEGYDIIVEEIFENIKTTTSSPTVEN